MQEPFRKRPRLSMFPDRPFDPSLDQDLDSMRYRNDLLLKSRFESIFEKYSQNFDGIGDEISQDSGDIVVDNGHLHSMTAETDTGVSKEEIKGRSLLRAMTEAPDREDSYFNEGADDVIMSIEEIAGNAAIVVSEDENIPDESDEELFGRSRSRRAPASLANLRHRSVSPMRSESDADSLFNVQINQR